MDSCKCIFSRMNGVKWGKASLSSLPSPPLLPCDLTNLSHWAVKGRITDTLTNLAGQTVSKTRIQVWCWQPDNKFTRLKVVSLLELLRSQLETVTHSNVEALETWLAKCSVGRA